ncbi:MAG: (2Fe-2S)-binding protein [Chloroflexi bacterium]|nr:MAG: (2Fe-2S)-binding protein [Chloroflexota bacterium]
MRVVEHPILGEAEPAKMIQIEVDGRLIPAREGEPIAAALLAAGTRVFRRTTKRNEPRGVYCAIGRCTDCAMTVNGRPNVRTCVTPAVDGMVVRTQQGLGTWEKAEE